MLLCIDVNYIHYQSLTIVVVFTALLVQGCIFSFENLIFPAIPVLGGYTYNIRVYVSLVNTKLLQASLKFVH